MYDIELTISFPSRLKTSRSYLEELFNTFLPEIKISESSNKGELFSETIQDEDTDTIIVFASDTWIGSYMDDIVKSNKRLIFEGPGNDPCVVFDNYRRSDVKEIVRACLNNSGQSCSSIKRIYVSYTNINAFVAEMKCEIDAYLRSYPEAINSIKSPSIADKIDQQIAQAKNEGAIILYGDACVIDGKFNPTMILSPNDTELVLEENFYAVIPIVVFEDEHHAETLIFKSNYGLNCSLFGDIPDSFRQLMQDSHKSTFINSTVVNPINYSEVTKLGGFRRSGFIIENGLKRQDSFYLEDLVFHKDKEMSLEALSV